MSAMDEGQSPCQEEDVDRRTSTPFDPKYEFDAPRFRELGASSDEDEPADAWFDHRVASDADDSFNQDLSTEDFKGCENLAESLAAAEAEDTTPVETVDENAADTNTIESNEQEENAKDGLEQNKEANANSIVKVSVEAAEIASTTSEDEESRDDERDDANDIEQHVDHVAEEEQVVEPTPEPMMKGQESKQTIQEEQEAESPVEEDGSSAPANDETVESQEQSLEIETETEITFHENIDVVAQVPAVQESYLEDDENPVLDECVSEELVSEVAELQDNAEPEESTPEVEEKEEFNHDKATALCAMKACFDEIQNFDKTFLRTSPQIEVDDADEQSTEDLSSDGSSTVAESVLAEKQEIEQPQEAIPAEQEIEQLQEESVDDENKAEASEEEEEEQKVSHIEETVNINSDAEEIKQESCEIEETESGETTQVDVAVEIPEAATQVESEPVVDEKDVDQPVYETVAVEIVSPEEKPVEKERKEQQIDTANDTQDNVAIESTPQVMGDAVEGVSAPVATLVTEAERPQVENKDTTPQTEATDAPIEEEKITKNKKSVNAFPELKKIEKFSASSAVSSKPKEKTAEASVSSTPSRGRRRRSRAKTSLSHSTPRQTPRRESLRTPSSSRKLDRLTRPTSSSRSRSRARTSLSHTRPSSVRKSSSVKRISKKSRQEFKSAYASTTTETPVSSRRLSTRRGRSSSVKRITSSTSQQRSTSRTRRSLASANPSHAPASTPRRRFRQFSSSASSATSSARKPSRRRSTTTTRSSSIKSTSSRRSSARTATSLKTPRNGRKRSISSSKKKLFDRLSSSGTESQRAHLAAKKKGATNSNHFTSDLHRDRSASRSRSRSRTRSRSRNPHLTKPQAPRFATDSRVGHHKIASSLEIELAEIERARALIKERNRINKENMQIVCEPMGEVLPVRSTIELTEPVEFKFRTEERISKHHQDDGDIQEEEEHKIDPAVFKNDKGVTEPAPFRFETDSRLSHPAQQVEKKEFVPLCVQTENIFRSAVRHGDTDSATGVKASEKINKNVLTQPKPFKLSSARRRKSVVSTAEKEEQIIKSRPKFRARPLNPKILRSTGDYGVPRVKKTKNTAIKEFKLSKSRERKSSIEDAPTKKFKARSIPSRVYHATKDPRDVVREQSLRKQKLTTPKTPPLSKSNKTKKAQSPEFSAFKARPIPQGQFHLMPSQKEKTKFKEFNLQTEVRGKSHSAQYKARIQQEEEELKKARQFKARDMYDGPAQVPVLPSETDEAYLVEPEPFQLESVARSERARQKWREKVYQEIEKEQEQFESFHARPNPNSTAVPFLVKKSKKPLTEVQPFALASDIQAENRAEFEHEKEERMQAAEAAKKQREAEEKAAEEEEIRRIRRAARPKINRKIGAKVHLPPKIEIPLTTPMSPQFHTTRRSNSRSRNRRSIRC